MEKEPLDFELEALVALATQYSAQPSAQPPFKCGFLSSSIRSRLLSPLPRPSFFVAAMIRRMPSSLMRRLGRSEVVSEADADCPLRAAHLFF